MESNFAINYLSRFVLTGRLLPLLPSTGAPGTAARIVVIGGAATNGKIHYDDINLTRNFGILTMVPQFCQANDLFFLEQARRLAESEDRPGVTVTTLKVGVVRTNIRRDFPLWKKVLVTLVFDPLLGQPPEQIAESAMRLLVSPEFEGRADCCSRRSNASKRLSPARASGTHVKDSASGSSVSGLRLGRERSGNHSLKEMNNGRGQPVSNDRVSGEIRVIDLGGDLD